MSHSTGYNTQSNAGEDIGVVPLAGVEGASVRQLHFVKRTPAGEDATALTSEERRKENVHLGSEDTNGEWLFCEDDRRSLCLRVVSFYWRVCRGQECPPGRQHMMKTADHVELLDILIWPSSGST